jgi:hypothetical protein
LDEAALFPYFELVLGSFVDLQIVLLLLVELTLDLNRVEGLARSAVRRA